MHITPKLIISLFALSIGTAFAEKLPDTRVGKLATSIIDAINSGDSARMRSAAKASLSHPDEDVVRLEQSLWKESGGIDVVSFEDRRALAVLVRAKRGGRYAKVMFFPDRDGSKLEMVAAKSASDPDAKVKDVLPIAKSPNEIASIVDRAGRRLNEQGRYSGSVVVMKGNDVLLEHSYGLANRSFGVQNGPHTRYNIASMGKMFTAVSIAQLIEAGKLKLESKVSDLLPEFPNPSIASKITVRDLLNHTAGLGMVMDSPKYDRERRYEWESDYYPTMVSQPLLFEPGTAQMYSNAGFVLLAAIVEKISGERFDLYLQKHIYSPAGMTETGSYQLDDVIPNEAEGYMHSADDPFAAEPLRTNRNYVPMPSNGAGGEYSTAMDMARFARALLAGKLVSQEWVSKLISNETQVKRATLPGYGFGFGSFDIDGKKAAGHSGGGPNIGINSDLEFFTDGSYTVSVLGNSDAPEAQDFARRIMKMLAAR